MVEEKEVLESGNIYPGTNGRASASMAMPRKSVRRYDIDWLRVILFALLIWYHYLFFTPPRTKFDESNLLLTFALDVMHEWRLAALFVISGMSTAFAFKHKTWPAYLQERGWRLLVPLLFASYILLGGIVTPAETTGLLLTIFPASSEMPYGHLWFVYNLLIYSVILTPLFVHLRQNLDGRLVRAVRATLNIPYGLGIIVAPPLLLALCGLLFKPWMRGEVGMWWEFPWYFLFFAFGYLLLIDDQAYFAVLDKIRIPVALLLPVLAILYYFCEKGLALPGIMSGGWVRAGYPPFSFAATLGTFIQAFHAWFWCLFIFSFGAKWLNHPSPALAYLNQAVYPAFIAHQQLIYLTVILLGRLAVSKPIGDFLLGPLIVTLGCLLIFECARRARLARVAFGIKPLAHKNEVESRAGGRAASELLFHMLTLIAVLMLMGGSLLYWHFPP